MKVKSKVWIEEDGKPVFGEGKEYLLELIDTHGSINKAASTLGISYRKAWSYINAMEETLKIRLIERSKGGRGGGGSRLTSEARYFLSRFERLCKGIDEIVNERFKMVFK